MAEFIPRRVLQAILVLFVMTLLVVLGVHVIGNPVHIFATPECTPALVLALGICAGLGSDSWISKGIMGFSMLGFSVPIFWIGLILILVFSVRLGWFPAIGRGDLVEVMGVEVRVLTLDGLRHLAMPAFTLSLTMMAMVIRLTRAGMREVLHADCIRFARATCTHVLKNIRILKMTVPGMPSLTGLPSGCHFHPRCPFATARWRAEAPALRGIAPGGRAACHLNDTHQSSEEKETWPATRTG